MKSYDYIMKKYLLNAGIVLILFLYSTALIAQIPLTFSAPLPTCGIKSVLDASRCGTGTVTLNVTNYNIAATVNWYAAAAGGSSLGTGTSFTTPSISSTTTYYVESNDCPLPSPPRTAVTATINNLPAIITGTRVVCLGSTSTTTVSDATPGGTWSSATPAVATIDAATGAVTGVSVGTSVISYTLITECSVSTTITVNPLPTLVINNPAAVCSPATVNITLAAVTAGSTAGLTLSYWTDAAATSVYATPATASAGTYYVKGIKSTPFSDCFDIKPVTVTVNPLPVASIAYPGTPFCAIGTATVNQTGQTGGTYSSTAGLSIDGSTGTINLAACTAGSYTVTYSFTNGVCANTTTCTVPVRALPAVAPITGLSSVCKGTNITLADITPAGVWSSSNIAIASVSSGGVVTGVSAGTATIRYTVTDQATNCSAVATHDVTFVASPVATIAYPGSPFCSTGTATVTRTGQTGGTYSSTVGLSIDGSTGTINLATSSTGAYTVTYSFTNGTCPNSTTTGVTISPLSAATIAYPGSPYCAAGSATVTRTGQTGGTYSSTAGLSINGSTGAINLAASTAGTYTVSYSFTNGTCPNTTTSSVTIWSLPVVAPITGPVSVCAGSAITLADLTGGGAWTSGNLANATVNNVGVVTGVSSGLVIISYTVASMLTGCSTIVKHDVTVSALAAATITYPGSPYCAAGAATVTRTGQTGGTYSSTAGLSIDSSTGAINLATSTAGTYTVTYSFTNGTCPNTTTCNVTISNLPIVAAITGLSSVCAGSTITLADLTPGGVWSSSDLAIAPVSNGGVVTGVSAGSATISYTVTSMLTGCSTIVTHDVIINALAVATIAYPGTPYCAGGTAAVTRTGQTGGTYSSTAGLFIDGNTGTINLATSSIGTYTVTYSFTNGTCPNTATTGITIGSPPVVAAITGLSAMCAGSAITLADLTPGGLWSSSNLAKATVNNSGVVTGISAGLATINYTVTSMLNGCSTIVTHDVTISALATATIAYPGSPYCATGTAIITQTGQTGGTYSSTAGLSIDGSTGAINLAASTTGTYTVTYSFTNGTCPNAATSSVTIRSLPSVAPITGSVAVCSGSAVTLADLTVGGVWSSSNLTKATVNGTGVVTGVSAGLATINYTVVSMLSGCSTVVSHDVTVNALAVAAIAYPGSPYCAAGTATVTQTGQTGGSYSSTAGLAINSSTGAINLATSTAGAYTVTYSFTNGTCPTATTTGLTIRSLPIVVVITGPAVVCPGSTIILSDLTPGGAWSSSDLSKATVGTGGVVSGISAGLVTINYAVTSILTGCSAIVAHDVTINSLPVAAITYPGSPYCAGGTATVTQTGQAGGTYSSTPGLSINSSTGTINLTASTAGSYTVTYSFSNGTCPDKATTDLKIIALPAATIAYSGSPYCAGGTASVIQTGQAGGTYNSTAGLSIDVSTGTVNLATSTPGIYTVTYGFNNGTCPNTTTALIAIGSPPTVSPITGPSIVCAGSSITLNDLTAGGIWSSSDLAIATVNGGGVVTGVSAGSANISYTVANMLTGCSTIVTHDVNITASPVASIAYSGSPYCAGGTATVTRTGLEGGIYTSAAGLSIDGSTGEINLATSTAGTYTVTYSFTNGTCPNNATTVVSIGSPPIVAAITGLSAVCAGSAITLADITASGAWSSSNLTIASVNSGGVVTGVSGGLATISYTVTSMTTGCSTTVTHNVSISAVSVAMIAYSGSPFCAIGTTTVTRTGQTGGTYSSTAGLSIDSSTGAINLAASTAGSYIVTYGFTNGTCPSTTTATVTVNALPADKIIATASASVCSGAGTNITVTSSVVGISYQLRNNVGNALIGSAVPGNGGTINLPTGNLTTTTTFNVLASSGSCMLQMTVTPTVTVNTLPVAAIAYPGSPYCAAGTAAVVRTGQTGGTYSSTAGLTIDSSTGAINLATSLTSTYTVTYSFTNGTCLNTANTGITINPFPTDKPVVAASALICSGTGTNIIVTSSAIGISYQLRNNVGNLLVGSAVSGNGGTINLPTGNLTTTTTFNVLATSGNCPLQMTATPTVTIIALPIATIAYPGTPFCATGTAAVTRTGQTGGTYSSAAGLSINSSTGTINLAASTSGTYLVIYSFTNGTCPGTATTGLTVNAMSSATIAYPGTPYCATGTAAVTRTGQAGGTFSSTAGLSIDGSTGAINLAASTAGTYTVTYNFTNGTCPNTTTNNITIWSLPVVAAITGPGTVCAGSSITLSDLTAGGVWGSSDLAIASVSNSGIVTGISAGTAIIRYTVINMMTGCSTMVTYNVTISALSAAALAYSGSPFCATGAASVTRTGQFGGIYSSTAGLSVDSSTGAINLAASSPGNYTVIYSFTNGICPNTASAGITVNPVPTDKIIEATSASVCLGTGTTITVISSAVGISYQLRNNNGNVLIGSAVPGNGGTIYLPTGNITSNTTFNVLAVSGNCTLQMTVTPMVTINPLPVAVIAYIGSPYCATGTAAVTRTGQVGGTYGSTTGLSIDSSTGAINLTASTAGTYTVTYNFTNGTCPNTTTTVVKINPLSVAAISYPGTPYCAIGSAAITQTGQIGGSYTSTAGLSIDGSTGAINLAASTAGMYTVTYSFTNGSCPGTITTGITIKSLPTVAAISGPVAVCPGSAVTLVDVTAGGVWSSNDLAKATVSSSGVVTGVSPGSATMSYTITSIQTGCTVAATHLVTINALAVATISYPGSPYCATGMATVTGTGQTGGIYSSTTGLSIDSSTGAINLVASTAGTYTVNYNFTNGICPNATTAVVTINPIPTDKTIAVASASVCPGTGTDIFVTSSAVGTAYQLRNNIGNVLVGPAVAGNGGTISLPTGNLATATTFNVLATLGNCPLQMKVTPTVTIIALPVATIAYGGSPYCAAGTATVSQTGQTGGSYSSNAGLSIDSSTGTINLTTSTPGNYTVTYSFSNGICPNTSTTGTITISPLPAAPTAIASQSFCGSGTVSNLSATAPAGSAVNWYTGITGGALLPGTTPLITATTYYAESVNTNSGCVSSGRNLVIATINSIPVAPIGILSQSFCSNISARVSDLVAAGLNKSWYSTASSVNIVAQTTVLVNGTTYYASQTVSGCESILRLPVIVSLTDCNTPVNHPPVVSDITKSGVQNKTIEFVNGDFTSKYADPDNDALFKIRIESLPAHGELSLSGIGVSIGQEIKLSDLNKLIYTPAKDFTGDDSFRWLGHDGKEFSLLSAYILINIVKSEIIVSKGLSPNGDGVNDFFVIEGADKFIVTLRVFNRWGNKVFESNQYKNDWSGVSNVGMLITNQLPGGTYFYTVNFNNGEKEIIGYLTLIR